MEDNQLTLKSILFVCNINSIRSPMAEAILKLWFNKKIFIDSCGIRKGKIDHMAVEVMKEKGFDLSNHKTRSSAKDFSSSFISRFFLSLSFKRPLINSL